MANENETTVVEETSATMLDVARNSAAIALWSDEKKKDYVKVFRKRATASTYISRETARRLATTARDKHFLGEVQLRKVTEECNQFAGAEIDNYYHNREKWMEVYDRTKEDLDSIINQRVKALIDNLPSLKAAMQILDADTADKMIRKDELEKECQQLVDEFNELSETIAISELDQNMTIGAFRLMVKEREAAREAKLKEIDEKAKEGQELEKHIYKVLFKGLPGIGDEIMAVVKDLYKQSQELGTTMRNVENVVLYGDNEAALKILETFNKDEHQITTDIGKRFQESLEKLRLRVDGKKLTAAKAKALKQNE